MKFDKALFDGIAWKIDDLYDEIGALSREADNQLGEDSPEAYRLADILEDLRSAYTHAAGTK